MLRLIIPTAHRGDHARCYWLQSKFDGNCSTCVTTNQSLWFHLSDCGTWEFDDGDDGRIVLWSNQLNKKVNQNRWTKNDSVDCDLVTRDWWNICEIYTATLNRAEWISMSCFNKIFYFYLLICLSQRFHLTIIINCDCILKSFALFCFLNHNKNDWYLKQSIIVLCVFIIVLIIFHYFASIVYCTFDLQFTLTHRSTHSHSSNDKQFRNVN